jgi:hypothetical protein
MENTERVSERVRRDYGEETCCVGGLVESNYRGELSDGIRWIEEEN